MRQTFIFIALLLMLASCQPEREPVTLIIVRHAEKLSSGDDPGLTGKGQKRARRLAELLSRQSIGAVYSTDYQRTVLTGAPTAKANNVEVTLYDAADAELFLKEVMSRHAGETVLITGHSNTVPGMVNLLSGATLDDFADEDYGNLFVITGRELGRCTSVNLFY